MAGFDIFQQLAVISALLLAIGYVYHAWSQQKAKGKVPRLPGPAPKFLVGNLADLPPAGAQEWVHWLKHKALYGPISSLTVLGQTIVIVNDYKIAVDLMEKRSATNSGRPRMVFGGEMCGWDDTLSGQQYDIRFREYRKAIHTTMGTSAAINPYRDDITLETRRFLLRVLERPESLRQHIRTKAGAVILKIGYGYNIETSQRDPLVDLADEGLQQFAQAAVPGAWMVDVIPALRHLPAWLLPSKRTAKHWKATITSIADVPHKFVQTQLQDGVNNTSHLAKLLETKSVDDHVAKWTAASLYTGGADTTVSSMSCFFLAMMLFPEVQCKAQAELDTLDGRLPEFADRAKLPYVDAVVKEVLRWHPVAPIGLPHSTTREDTYNGYRIPKGALLMPIQWAMLHDPKIYRDPEKFMPERFLGDRPEMDPNNIAFGFGRRGCPGKVLADATLFLSIANSLAVFDIASVGDVKADFNPGIISHPVPYDCSITPRSEKHAELIRSVNANAPLPSHGDAKYLDMHA